LAERLYDATLPGGWLITSVTELITSVTEPVQVLKTRWQPVVSGVYRKA
jgi:chemotaxis protein methyltransferase CheR